MQRARGQRITLVELMTMLGVLAVLAALLFPAIQQARASARRLECTENLRSIGLALHNYHTANGCLPMSQTVGDGHGNGHSVFTAILPYMEQVVIYNSYNFHLENWHSSNSTSVGSRVSAYLCPDNTNTASTPARELKLEESESSFAKGHYGANWGGGRDGWG